MIIGISGYIGSGKDTAASELITKYKFVHCSFAKPLKETVSKLFSLDMDLLNGYVDRHLREQRTPDLFNYSPRELLQIVGTVLRDSINPDIWLNMAIKEARLWDNVVFTDVRFPNEADFIKNNGKLIRIVRPGFMGDNHISETALNGYEFDKVISNDSTIDNLKMKVREYYENII
jgi:hypothetical protein